MGLEPLLGESFGRARPWDPAQLPVVPRTPRHPAAPLWVLGACMCWGVRCRPRQSSAAERAWGVRSLRLPVAASLKEPPPSLPSSLLSAAQTSIGPPSEAGAPEVCSGSCVQTRALQGPRVHPQQGRPKVYPGSSSPTPAHTQMMLARLHPRKHQQHRCVRALPCKGPADGQP